METIGCGMRIELTSYQKMSANPWRVGGGFRMAVEIMEEKPNVENLDVSFLM